MPGSQGPPAWQVPAQPYAYAPHAAVRSAGSGYSIAGIICGALALVFCPLVLGGVGLYLSGKATSRGESLAGAARTVSIIGLVGGMILGVALYARM